MSQFGSHFDDINNLSNLLNESRQASETPSEKFNQPACSAAQSNVVVSSKGSGLTLKKKKNRREAAAAPGPPLLWILKIYGRPRRFSTRML